MAAVQGLMRKRPPRARPFEAVGRVAGVWPPDAGSSLLVFPRATCVYTPPTTALQQAAGHQTGRSILTLLGGRWLDMTGTTGLDVPENGAQGLPP